ncbi:hypothetical protein ETAA8_02140 [Anatilimnocola aggregata]|uniref:Uncharacterized protein n=1 Tax=Anatilimnocola aggregata TaxID=2528021 RepID=A0A517Y4V5_9BACT|nr:hypothetical protein [Anatilimnocola aggregata]QDU25152.1 hypothetical protein ETAA8_02140 [Anatilimnocola aggregata]
MNFSIRTGLIAVSIVAVLLGAIVSKSPLVMELATNLVLLGICLTLALAIWDREPLRRAFWTGFFVLGFGNVVLASYFNAYQQSTSELSTLLMGQPQPGGPAVSYPRTRIIPSSSFKPPVTEYLTEEVYEPTLTPPQPVPTTTAPNSAPSFAMPPSNFPPPPMATPYYSSDYYLQFEAIRSSLPVMFSLLVAGIGGWVTMWISHQRSTSAAREVTSGL